MSDEQQRRWYNRIIPSTLRQAFDATPNHASAPDGVAGEYRYDESALVAFVGADLDEDVDAKTRHSQAGFTGCAEFRYVQEPATPGVMPFAVDHRGKRLTGTFLLEYDSLPRRIRHLEENGIRPTETRKALADLDAKLNAVRREAGLNGRVLQFPDADPAL